MKSAEVNSALPRQFAMAQRNFTHTTGLFRVRGNFDTPLNSVVDGPILKYFEVVIAITGGFDLVYNNASQVGNYLLKIWFNFWTFFATNEISGKSDVYFH